jgi:rhomboid protease GluP
MRAYLSARLKSMNDDAIVRETIPGQFLKEEPGTERLITSSTLPLEPTLSTAPRKPLVTHALVGICIAVFLAMLLFRVSPTHPTTEQLLRWGANFGPLTLGGQWWRLLTSMFLHIGIVHLAVNMWCLWDLGSLAEHIYGRFTFLAIYIATGLSGAILGLAWHPFVVVAGASGAIFGVAGALIACFYFGKLPFPKHSIKAALLSLFAFAGYNLFLGIVNPRTDNAAHLGGLVSGLLLGFLLVRIPGRSVLAVASLCLIACCVIVTRTRGYAVAAEHARTELASGHTDAAIGALAEAVRDNPNFTQGYFLLGQAYMQKQQFAKAEAAYRHGLALNPKASDIHYQLGVAVMAQGRAQDALTVFGDLAKSDPSNLEAEMGIGTAAEMTGDYQLALTAFRRAAQLDPRSMQAYSNLGLAALQTKQFDEAIAAFSKCVQLQPNRPEPLLSLAVAYKAKGMDREAEAAYQRAMEFSQKNH